MKGRFAPFLIIFSVLLSASVPSFSEVEISSQKTLDLKKTLLDVAVSLNGKWIFVLTDQHRILVFSEDGNLNDEIPVDKGVNGIQVGAREDMLYLIRRSDKKIQVVMIDFIEEINVLGSPLKGRSDAPVTIAVFSEFQCPYCARLVPLLEQVLKAYPEDVRIAFKNFPLRNHRFSQKAAVAALAAGRQGKFWEFHDLLFKNHQNLSNEKINEIAEELALDPEMFERDLNAPEIMAIVRRDMVDGSKAGVRGTPMIFVNGRALRHRTLEGFRNVIEKELEKLREKTESPS